MGFSEILYDKIWNCKRLSQESCGVRQEVDVLQEGSNMICELPGHQEEEVWLAGSQPDYFVTTPVDIST